MTQGLGVTQLLQQLEFMAENHRKAIKDIERFKKNLTTVIGTPENNNDGEQDQEVLRDYCLRMFVKNAKTVEEALVLFTGNSKSHLDTLRGLTYVCPRGPEVITMIKEVYK